MILEGKNEKKTDKVTESVTESWDMESHFNTSPRPRGSVANPTSNRDIPTSLHPYTQVPPSHSDKSTSASTPQSITPELALPDPKIT